MHRAELEYKLRNILAFHFQGDLWSLRPQLSNREYDKACIESIIDFIHGTKSPQAIPKPGLSPLQSQDGEGHTDELTLEINQDIGRKIEKLRKRRSYSQVQLAKKAKLTLQEYKDIVAGKVRTRFWQYEQIMHALNKPASAALWK